MGEPPAGTNSASAAADPGFMGRGPRPLTRRLTRFFSLAIVGALLFVFHGISFHLTPWSQAIINGIVKYGYGTAGQADATVVLFREENLRALKESYPVSYERHAEVLDALSVYRPRAVFVDFAFIDPRRPEEVARLSEAICELAAAGTTVYLAAPAADSGQASPTIADGLLKCARLAGAQMDSANGVSGVLTYSNGARTATGFVPTPAFALAADALKLRPEDAQPMEIIWANGVAPLNKKWMNCRSEGAFAHLVDVLRHQPMSAKLRCPYTTTISVGHLLGSTGDEDIATALTGRTVFYGASFQMTGDRVLSPVYEELPGVYLHAMAYDNLVTFGRDYKRAYRDLAAFAGGRIVIPLSAVVDVVLLLATVAMLLLVDEPTLATRLRGRLVSVGRAVRWAALGLAALLVVVSVAVPTVLVSVFLGLPLVLTAFAFLHLAAPGEAPTGAAHGFLGRHLATVAVAVAAVVLFLAVDRGLGLEAALLLVVLPGYFVYKVLVAKDVLFVATAMLLVLSSVLSFLPPINLGPRNVIAYVAFFEVARHVIERADKAAGEYARLRSKHPEPREWGLNPRMMRVLDWLFALCARSKEGRHGTAVVASA